MRAFIKGLPFGTSSYPAQSGVCSTPPKAAAEYDHLEACKAANLGQLVAAFRQKQQILEEIRVGVERLEAKQSNRQLSDEEQGRALANLIKRMKAQWKISLIDEMVEKIEQKLEERRG